MPEANKNDNATAGAKPDQADVIAQLATMQGDIAKTGLSLADLISQHASLTAGKAAVDGEVAKITGDKTKLVAGANLPTDLVTAANTIAELTKERDALKATAKSVDDAAAAKIVALGFAGGQKQEPKADAGQQAKEKNYTAEVLGAIGVASIEEAQAKFIASKSPVKS